jgi:hypothetical protein
MLGGNQRCFNTFSSISEDDTIDKVSSGPSQAALSEYSTSRSNSSSSTTSAPTKGEIKAKEQAIMANKAFDFFFPNQYILTDGVECRDGRDCEVMAGPGGADIDWDELMMLASSVAPVKSVTSKGHLHLGLSVNEKSREGRKLLVIIRKLFQPLIVAGYHVRECQLVARNNNNMPYHQDKRTGRCVFTLNGMEKYEDDARAGERVLINLGAYGGDERPMCYRLSAKGGHKELLRLNDRCVGMNQNAAGSACCSNVEHGRFGNGITMSVDIMLPRKKNFEVGGGIGE